MALSHIMAGEEPKSPLKKPATSPPQPDRALERTELLSRLKRLIVATLKLDDIKPEEIPDHEPLIGGGLNLDSIDALELVVSLEKEFGIKISSSEESRSALASVGHLADFILARTGHERRSA